MKSDKAHSTESQTQKLNKSELIQEKCEDVVKQIESKPERLVENKSDVVD